MIEAKDAKAALERVGFSARSADADILLIHDYIDQQVVRGSREGTELAYLNREQEVVARLNKTLSNT